MGEKQFICDMMLGRLAKWLRTLGYDTLYFEKIGDGELIKIAKREGRILLTRDTGLMSTRPVKLAEIRSQLIRRDHLPEQLGEVIAASSLKRRAPRCTICNAKLGNLAKDRVKELVPPYVFETQENFSRCPVCKRIYWKATHWKKIEELLAEVMQKKTTKRNPG